MEHDGRSDRWGSVVRSLWQIDERHKLFSHAANTHTTTCTHGRNGSTTTGSEANNLLGTSANETKGGRGTKTRRLESAQMFNLEIHKVRKTQ